MQPTIGAGAPDVIAYAFYRMGFRPRESLVLVGMRDDPQAPPGRRGKRMLCGVVGRVDLPPAAHRRAQTELLVSRVRGHGHRAAFALIVSERPLPALVKVVRSAVRAADLRLLDVFWVGDSRYRSCLCPNETCCPPEGFPLAEVHASQAAAELVLRGRTLGADEASIVADVVPDPLAVLPAAALARPAVTGRRPSPRSERMRRLDLWRDLVAAQGEQDPTDIAAGDLADLCRGLDDVLFRDALLVALAAPAGADGLTHARAMAGGRGEAAMVEVERRRPDRPVLERGRRVLAALARRTPPGRRAEALALLAWAAWWQGDGGRGRLLAEQALADAPAHRLARLVAAMLEAALPPPWVQSEDVADEPGVTRAG